MRTDPNQPRARFRRPIPPAPLDPVTLSHPAVPRDLDGLRICHIADPHVRRPIGSRSAMGGLIDALGRTPVDLAVLCGDFMHRAGQEGAALDVLGRVLGAVNARLGVYGVFGNHDTAGFIRLARELPGVRWLCNDFADPARGLRILGATYPEDFTGAALAAEPPTSPGDLDSVGDRPGPDRLVLGLCHYPNEVFAASDLGVHVLFAGHTHGGQWRLSRRLAPHTSCDLPMHLASGVLRHRGTLCVISRGLGEAIFEARINCPRHAPLITLRRGSIGPQTGGPAGGAGDLRQAIAW